MDRIVRMAIDAYVKVMGIEKWNALSAEEQRTVIMTMVKELDKAIDKL